MNGDLLGRLAPSLSDALAEVERMALRQAIKRSSFAGPPVESVTIGELAAIIREVRAHGAVVTLHSLDTVSTPLDGSPTDDDSS